MVKAIGYVRVSTDKQVESGLSLEAQQEKIRAMAVVKGVELVDVIVDAGESAKNLARPGVQQVLKMVKAKAVGAVIVAKLDRLSRSIQDTCYLVELFGKKQVALVSLAESLDTESAMGRCVLNVIAAFSQMERESTAEKTSVALQQKIKRGERTGTVPYGMRVGEGKKLAPDAAEQAIIARIKILRSEGASFREIANILNEQGLKTRRGTPWRFQYVANILGAKA